ncbi:efflux RND transporter periplasmic adaptor subunit [Pseudolysobacter antarcticus]|uniref:Efflux RND transporter periplasmic adaptor subunit n=1 Tax=Pseudolysobacter antarcticus TaxID=2511995 RepID=A0A411HLQ1_9GAMM|nr:efflux RND transporter periplasmic adaptor subunit [Pseudolysobacter antarcticus]QBB71431.1 efflux RND transporter periplasmic adaptor subunit [Pseudolysobacter antarcticus]
MSSHHRISSRQLHLSGVIALVIAIAVAAFGIYSRVHGEVALKHWTDERAIRTVTLIEPGKNSAEQALILPGNVQAFVDAPIYARATGYLKRWYVDIGTPVKAGQLLAELETPEIDQQLRQAEADLATAQANAKLANITAQRWQNMLSADSVSKQESDEKSGNADARKAGVAAAQANVARLRELESFKRIVAPFDGILTARNTDVGALIDAGNGKGAELFRVADISRLRIYVNVPQSFAGAIKPGMLAEVHLPGRSGNGVAAKVVNTAQAINPSTRSLLVELQADNSNGQLLAGSYAEVHFSLPAQAGVMRLPSSALLFREQGMQVGTLGTDNKVQLKQIEIGRDFGTEVEVLNGLDADARVIDNPSDSLSQNETVKIAQTTTPTVANQ